MGRVRPYSLPQTRMSQANPKENVSYGSERSSTLCSRLAKAREGSDRLTLSAPVEQKAKEGSDRRALSASAWLRHASSDREGSGGLKERKGGTIAVRPSSVKSVSSVLMEHAWQNRMRKSRSRAPAYIEVAMCSREGSASTES